MKALINLRNRFCAMLDDKLNEQRCMINNGDTSSLQYELICSDIVALFTSIRFINDEILKEME